MNLRTLPKTKKMKGQRILVRVDWNIPLEGEMEPEALLKIERSLVTIYDLAKRGAIVILLTHLGRPKKREAALSTKQLVPIVKRLYGLELTYHKEIVSNKTEREWLVTSLSEAEEGSIHLLENVRFEEGEEKNSVALSKAYAMLGDVFVNDAFASCHRSHASVAGIAKQLPSFAGGSLQEEVKMLSVFLKKPQRPFVAVVGGKKLTTKLPVIKALLKMCDAVMVGGAMSHACFVAQGISIGGSYVEKEGIVEAQKLVQAPNLFLPTDVILAKSVSKDAELVRSPISSIGKKMMVVDAGPATLKVWAEKIQGAKTVLWNGPIGVTEIKSMGAGSRFLARVIGARSRGAAFGVAGGGDTIPVITQTKTQDWFDFVSTGGGAMLEFIVLKGCLPGLVPLLI
ncbi:phosphoglycerate kinase [Patescibacteria group bacterium]|nr:phosphoglycerate kinase [Patescibacteria group bacterium]